MPKQMSIKEASQIAETIEKLKKAKKLSWIEACIEHCDESGMEYEVAGRIVKKNPMIKALIEQEAIELNTLKGNNDKS